jgi:hypothetical protein
MSKAKTAILTILAAALLVFLGLYAVGVLEFASISYASEQEYSGSFTYNGGLQEGHFSGYGSLDFQNGDSFSGWFKDGRFDGNGIYRHLGSEESENWLFDGLFEDGHAVKGVFYFEDGYSVPYDRDSPKDMPSSQKIVRVISDNGEQTIVYE